jgi:hypothetical protein
MYRGMLHSIASACVAAEADSPHRDDSIAGLERLLSQNTPVQARVAATCVVCCPLFLSHPVVQAGLGVQWRACAQALLAISSIKRIMLQFKSLLVSFPAHAPPVLRPVASSTSVPLSSPSASTLPLPSAMQAALLPLQSDDACVPVTPVSIFDADDLCSFPRDGSASNVCDGDNAAASDAFLSQIFGEDAQKIFQPFL